MPKSQFQRFCIYCGGSGLTQEHLYADWLRKYIPRELPQHLMSSTVSFPHKSETIIQRKTGDTHSRRLRRVCLACNRGWMSQLQQAAMPHVIPMLEGRPTSLNRAAQKIVSAWVAMTVMTAEYANETMVAVPQCERDYLRVTRKPPKTWRIWIGHYSRSHMTQRYWHSALALTDQEVERVTLYVPHPPNTQTTAICFGEHLFVYVMSSDVALARGLIRRWRFPVSSRASLRQIWPSAAAAIAWPLGPPLSGAQVSFIAEDFYKRVERSGYIASLR